MFQLRGNWTLALPQAHAATPTAELHVWGPGDRGKEDRAEAIGGHSVSNRSVSGRMLLDRGRRSDYEYKYCSHTSSGSFVNCVFCRSVSSAVAQH